MADEVENVRYRVDVTVRRIIDGMMTGGTVAREVRFLESPVEPTSGNILVPFDMVLWCHQLHVKDLLQEIKRLYGVIDVQRKTLDLCHDDAADLNLAFESVRQIVWAIKHDGVEIPGDRLYELVAKAVGIGV